MTNNISLVTFVMGTRPEIIKLAPVIIRFKQCKFLKVRIVLTGQHKEMAYSVMDLFNLREDKNLDLMQEKQSLTHISTKVLKGLENDFNENKPKLVIVQGDTSTAFAAALAAFYEKVPLAHVEAGLRTDNIMDPYPEEVNRRLISQIASIHFSPTSSAAKNLRSSGIKNNIFITGNTVIDSMHLLLHNKKSELTKYIKLDKKKKVILVTVHRRENWGDRLRNIANSLLMITEEHKDVTIIIPMHKNKLIRKTLTNLLANKPSIILIEALPYDQLVELLSNCYLVLTDSGGIQEEAPSFGKPVLVLRETTERQEAIDSGTAMLVGTNTKYIFEQVSLLLKNDNIYKSMSSKENPFGDGKASQKILNACLELLA
tara:strand:+ start:2638 stop:3753 length:1116 start_codon:yes stop_codon:yes gene_type:complete